MLAIVVVATAVVMFFLACDDLRRLFGGVTNTSSSLLDGDADEMRSVCERRGRAGVTSMTLLLNDDDVLLTLLPMELIVWRELTTLMVCVVLTCVAAVVVDKFALTRLLCRRVSTPSASPADVAGGCADKRVDRVCGRVGYILTDRSSRPLNIRRCDA